jgi:hypothetical protein
MRAKSALSYYDVPRKAFDLLPEVFQFGQYSHAPASGGKLGGAWFAEENGDTRIRFFLDDADLAQYRRDKCLD